MASVDNADFRGFVHHLNSEVRVFFVNFLKINKVNSSVQSSWKEKND